jgi:hypothetical protein
VRLFLTLTQIGDAINAGLEKASNEVNRTEDSLYFKPSYTELSDLTPAWVACGSIMCTNAMGVVPAVTRRLIAGSSQVGQRAMSLRSSHLKPRHREIMAQKGGDFVGRAAATLSCFP